MRGRPPEERPAEGFRSGSARRSSAGGGRDVPTARLDRRAIEAGGIELGRRDATFARILEDCGPPPLWLRPQSLRTLVHIVLEQKVSLTSALAVMGRVDALCPAFDPASFLAVPEPALRGAGVSERKIGYCRALARALLDGSLSLPMLRRLDDTEVIERLTAVRGIGPWTAGVYLTMALARQDAWPSGDRALAVGVAERWALDGVPSYPVLDTMAEAWRPWRGVASRLIWHGYLVRRGG